MKQPTCKSEAMNSVLHISYKTIITELSLYSHLKCV
jgi:hypothetical protein